MKEEKGHMGGSCTIADDLKATEGKIVMRSDKPDGDWVEDFAHENGNYQCLCFTCKNAFYGHKRRVTCKACDSKHEKPIHARPSLYAFIFESLKRVAKEHGYNLVLHGSLARDLDLIAIPWVDEPKDDWEMIKAFEREINGIEHSEPRGCMFSILPGGRKSYVININRGNSYNNYMDEQWYIDISVTPRIREKTFYPYQILKKVGEVIYKKYGSMNVSREHNKTDVPYQIIEVVEEAMQIAETNLKSK